MKGPLVLMLFFVFLDIGKCATPKTFFDYQVKIKFLKVILHFILYYNKHCEILVSCSDKDGNCIQGHETACKLMKLHACS